MAKKSSKSTKKTAVVVPETPPPGEKCALCGHWSVATEYGLDDNAGYCDRWEKITSRSFWCDEFVSKDDYNRYQQELAEEHEEYLDED